MILGYVRVSTEEQNEARQLETMKHYNCERVFIDKKSGKNTERPQLKELLDFARFGDIVVIHDFSRLARNTLDLLRLTSDFENKGIKLISSHENIDTSTPTGKLMLQILGSINEFERNIIKERQIEGIAIAKRQGKYKGRKPVNPANFEDLLNQYKNRQIKTKTQLAQMLNISRPTLDKLLKNIEITI